MAVAPLNKFLTFSVPIVPGEQTIYSAPVGVSAIVLRAQVANVAKGETYPTVTVTHRRKTNKTGNTRDIRIVKNTEIPPEDALIVIDGRFVLERTALITDSLVISGSQTGIVSIFNCEYDEPTGITTIITWDYHNFSVGDEITMSDLKFTTAGDYMSDTDKAMIEQLRNWSKENARLEQIANRLEALVEKSARHEVLLEKMEKYSTQMSLMESK